MRTEGNDLELLRESIRRFAAERDWDQFHSPKNLSMALVVEAAELVEHFQWLTEKQSADLSPDKLKDIEAEMADIFIYLVQLADKLNVNLAEAAERKIKENASKYPVDVVRGSSKKYTDY